MSDISQEFTDMITKIVSALSRQLNAEYEKSFTRSYQFYMIRFAEIYPDEQIVHALSGQLSRTHFLQGKELSSEAR